MGGEAGRAPSGGLRSCACSRTGWGRHHHNVYLYDIYVDSDHFGTSYFVSKLKPYVIKDVYCRTIYPFVPALCTLCMSMGDIMAVTHRHACLATSNRY